MDIIADAGYDPEYGARPLRRAIQTKVEDMLSDEIISGAVKAGDSITIGGSQGNITLRHRAGISDNKTEENNGEKVKITS